MSTSYDIIKKLHLQPHPEEGGFFRETYRSDDDFAAGALPERYGEDRCAGTAIYYMLTPGTFSALHRLKTDEIFHFYAGSPVRMLQLFPDGTGKEIILGSDVLAGQHPQVIVPRGVWQGSLLEARGDFALMGCTVSPGFEYDDYEHGDRAALIHQYPAFRDLITKLTAG